MNAASAQEPDKNSAAIPAIDAPKPRSLFSRLFKWCLRLVLLAVVLVLIAGVVAWFSRDWLLQQADALIVKNLEEREVYLSYEDVDLHVIRGLVVQEVTLWEDEGRTIPLISLDDVAFRPSLSQLLNKQIVEGQVSIKDAELALYARGEPVATVEDLSFKAFVEPSGMTVDRLEGLLFGVRLDGDGFLRMGRRDKDGKKIETAKSDDSEEERKPLDFSLFVEVAKWFSLDPKTTPPVLDLNFNIDRAAEDPIAVDAKLSGEQVSWRGVPFESLDFTVHYRQATKSVDVPNFAVSHRGGKAEGALTYFLEPRTLKIASIQSTLNLPSLAADLPFDIEKHLSMVSLQTEHPEIRSQGVFEFKEFGNSKFEVEFATPLSLTLNLDDYTSVPLQALQGKLAFGDASIAAEDLRFSLYGLDVNGNGAVRLGGGKPKAVAVAKPVETDVPLSNKQAPSQPGSESPTSPVIEADAEPQRAPGSRLSRVFAAIEKWTSFTSEGDRPKLDADFVVDLGADDPVVVQATLSGKAFTWQGVNLDSADIDCRYSQAARQVSVPSFELLYQGKPIRGAVDYGIASRKLTMKGIDCQADWISLCSDLPFGLDEKLAAVHLPDPPEVQIDGFIDLQNLEASDYTVACPRSVPIHITTGEQLIEVSGFKGTVQVTGFEFRTEDTEVLLGNGKLNWNGVYTLSNHGYDGTLTLTEMPLSELLKLAGKAPMAGIINGQVSGSGDVEVVMHSGSGDIAITETDALNIPVVGGLLNVLARIAPVFGTNTDESVSMSFATENGVMKTEDLTAKGTAFLVEAEGVVDWNDQSTQFEATANFDGVLQYITVIASKALEIEGSGPLDAIEWQFKNLDVSKLTGAARSLFGVGGRFIGVGGDGVKSVGEGVMKVGETATDGAKKVGEGVMKVGETATDGAKKVGEGVMKVGETATDGVKKVGRGLMRLIPGGGGKDDDDDEEKSGGVDGKPRKGGQAPTPGPEPVPAPE